MLGSDDAPGVHAAVRHLVELGHRDIAHVAGPDDLVHGRSRRHAWETALADAGLPVGPVVVSDFSPHGPVIRTPSADSEPGRGLQIVASLSVHWGWHPEPRGKAVYAILATETGV